MFTVSIYFKPMLSILPYNTRKKLKKDGCRTRHTVLFTLYHLTCVLYSVL